MVWTFIWQSPSGLKCTLSATNILNRYKNIWEGEEKFVRADVKPSCLRTIISALKHSNPHEPEPVLPNWKGSGSWKYTTGDGGLQELKVWRQPLLVLMHLLDVDVLTRRLDGSVFTLLESIRGDVLASQGQHMLAGALR